MCGRGHAGPQLPDDNAAFNKGLAEIPKDEQAAIAASYDWTGVTSVVDMGAGPGALLASILAENRVRGILFDRADVLPDADHLLRFKSMETSGSSARFCTTGRMRSAGPYWRVAGSGREPGTVCWSLRWFRFPDSQRLGSPFSTWQ